MREKQKQCIVTCEVGLVEFQRVIISSYFFINIIVLCLYYYYKSKNDGFKKKNRNAGSGVVSL
jgi:hypothetical protein